MVAPACVESVWAAEGANPEYAGWLRRRDGALDHRGYREHGRGRHQLDARNYAAGLEMRCPGGVIVFQRWALNSQCRQLSRYEGK